MSVVGLWTLEFDWGCLGQFNTDGINFSEDGTLKTDKNGYTGRWVEAGGMIVWKFDVGPTTYVGHVLGGTMAGRMFSFTGVSGCWRATKAETQRAARRRRKVAYDVTGAEAK
jgi:hypothetical protein